MEHLAPFLLKVFTESIDLLDYSELITDNSYILFLNFYKAFDSVEHQFIFNSLEKFGFGTTPRFDIKRGIRQGCPISPYLFLLVTQLLATHIKSSALKGITIVDREIVISQLADDTTIFLKDSTQVPHALNIISVFSKASGLFLNVNKCELMAVKDSDTRSISNIPVKDTIIYLGISITKDQKSRNDLNFTPYIEKAQKRLNLWLLRDLSLRGRMLITKAEGISRIT